MKNNSTFIISYIITVLLLSFVFSSCGTMGSISDSFNYAVEHDANIMVINKNHTDCLAAAQTDEDKSQCDEIYQNALDKENEDYAEKQNAIKEIDKCEEYQRWLLQGWGYPEKDVKKIAKQNRNSKNADYSFDANEAISELIKNGYKDKAAITKFEEELPKFGVSKDNAEQVMKEYYDNEYYTRDNFYKEPYFYLIGNNVYCNKKMLLDMGLIDDDNEYNNGNDSKDGDDNEVSNIPSTNTPGTETSITNEPTNTYLDESRAISKLSASQYRLNETKLTAEQELELNKVIAFMQKWPNSMITIVGHTCSIGSDVANQSVGLNRAHQAKLYMVAKGIAANRIEEISKAATEPCASNDTEDGRLQNRRITFIVK